MNRVAYADALTLVRATIDGNESMADEMFMTLTLRELCATFGATVSLAAALATETGRILGVQPSDLMHDLMPKTDTP